MYTSLILADGTGTVEVEGTAVVAVIPGPDAAPATSVVVTHSGTIVRVLGDATVLAFTLRPPGQMVPLAIPQTFSGPTWPTSGWFYPGQGQASFPRLQPFAVPDDPAEYTTVTYFDGWSTVVVGDAAAVALQLQAGPAVDFNTWSAHSFEFNAGTFLVTTDADRTIPGRELVQGAAIVFVAGAAAPRVWTMPTAADLDAAIALYAAGKPVSLPGSGAKSVAVINASGQPLTVQDSVDLGSFGGAHVIGSGQVGIILWGQSLFQLPDVGPNQPTSPGYSFFLSAENAAAPPPAPFPGMPWAGGNVGLDGTIVNQFGNLALAAPWVPGSGLYGLQFDPPPPGWNPVCAVTQLGVPPLDYVYGYTWGGPGLVDVGSRQVGVGPIDGAFGIVVLVYPPSA